MPPSTLFPRMHNPLSHLNPEAVGAVRADLIIRSKVAGIGEPVSAPILAKGGACAAGPLVECDTAARGWIRLGVVRIPTH